MEVVSLVGAPPPPPIWRQMSVGESFSLTAFVVSHLLLNVFCFDVGKGEDPKGFYYCFLMVGSNREYYK